MKFHAQRLLIIFALLILLALPLAGCDKNGSPASGPVLKVDKFDPDENEKSYMLTAAKMLVQGNGNALKSKDEYPNLYKQSRSALFISLTYPDKTADLAFGTGMSIIEAAKEAAGKLIRKVDFEDRKRARIRIDLVDRVNKPIRISRKKAPHFRPTLQGLYVSTDPPVAFHPLEIVSRGMFRKKGEKHKEVLQFDKKGLEQTVDLRGLPASVEKQLKSSDDILARPFTVISFIEGKEGKALDLYRWSEKDIIVNEQLLRDRINLAGDYLMRIMNDKGKFDYRYYAELDKSTRSYNLLRHCGTVYSMAQMYELTGDPKMLDAVKRGIQYVIDNHLTKPREKDQQYNFQCIRGEGYKDHLRDYCKLGGGGLFLVALSVYTRSTGDMTYLPIMQDLARFIEYMQESDGDMRSKYYFNDLPHKPFKSLFYPGEAAYGLGLLYQFDKNMKWVDVGHKAVHWLDQDRKGTPTWRLPIDHWLCIAMNELYKAKPNAENKQHVFDVGKGMIQRQRINIKSKMDWDLSGAFGRNPHTSSNGTMSEGSVANYYTAKQSGDDPEPFLCFVWYNAAVLVRLQYTDVSVSYFPKPQKVLGGYVAAVDVPEIQIDNVQHASSALIGLLNIMNEREWKAPDPTLYNQWVNERKR